MYLYISFVCVCLCVLEYVCVYSTKKIHQSCLYPLPLSPMLQAITSCKWPPKKILVTLRRCHVLQLPLHNADSFSIGRIHVPVPGGCRWGEGGGVRGAVGPRSVFQSSQYPIMLRISRNNVSSLYCPWLIARLVAAPHQRRRGYYLAAYYLAAYYI